MTINARVPACVPATSRYIFIEKYFFHCFLRHNCCKNYRNNMCLQLASSERNLLNFGDLILQSVPGTTYLKLVYACCCQFSHTTIQGHPKMQCPRKRFRLDALISTNCTFPSQFPPVQNGTMSQGHIHFCTRQNDYHCKSKPSWTKQLFVEFKLFNVMSCEYSTKRKRNILDQCSYVKL